MRVITNFIILIIICLSAASVATRMHDARALEKQGKREDALVVS